MIRQFCPLPGSSSIWSSSIGLLNTLQLEEYVCNLPMPQAERRKKRTPMAKSQSSSCMVPDMLDSL